MHYSTVRLGNPVLDGERASRFDARYLSIELNLYLTQLIRLEQASEQFRVLKTPLRRCCIRSDRQGFVALPFPIFRLR